MLKYIFFTIIFFNTLIIRAQISENFADGDFTSSPSWTVNSSADFTVNAGQLKSANTTTPGNFYISTTNTLASNCQWEFWVNLQFATSGTNYLDVYLISDNSNLQATSINGYFIKLGGTLDEICLFKRSGVLASSIKLIDGIDGSLASSTNNLIKIKVTRDASNTFSLERDITGLGTSYISEGTIIDGTFTTSNSFGFYIQQSTASFIGKHFFDDITVGPIVVDVTPPIVVGVNAISSNSVDLLFNENVDLTSSQVVSNYTINAGIGTPLTATRDVANFKLVHLTTSTLLTSGTTYSVDINYVKDVAGNLMLATTLNFTYVVYGTPNFKELVINEIFADPSPVINLTSCEFIEIYNRSLNTFNLSGLKFTDNVSLATLGNYTLTPNSYVIICPLADTAQFNTLGYTNKLGVSSFPSLTNAGKKLYLKTASGNFIDSVNYSDTWYKNSIKKDGGYTLEQINPNINTSCWQANNWIASNNINGGTPGFINSVYSITPDLVGPKITSIVTLDSLHISICFNDNISAAQLSLTSNYTINNGIGTPTAVALTNGNTCVQISLATQLINATNYSITLLNLADCVGNLLNPNVVSFSYYKPKPYDVVFNEIMPDPDPAISLPTEEYIELKNTTPYRVNLQSWTISTPSSTKKTPNITIEPDSFIVLTGTGNASLFDAVGILAYEVVSLPSLLNTGTMLSLRDSNGVMIHSINYKNSWYNDVNKNDGGWSLEQIDASNPCGEDINWHASKNNQGGTPGKRNSVASSNPDLSLPLLDRITIIDADTIMLFFNESLDSLSLLNPLTYLFDNGLGAPTTILPIGSDFKRIKLKLSTALFPNKIYHCTVNNSIRDCAGNSVSIGNTVAFGLPQPVLANDIVINEVLFDPNIGGLDFVELYNRSNHIIDLKDLRIGSLDTITNDLINTENISEDGFLFFPESYVVLSENENIIKQQYQTINQKGFINLTNLPAMNNDVDAVTLSDKNGVIIDNLKYNSKMHFPLLVNTKGVSLERIDFNRVSNDKTNWNSAAENVGFATPSYKNSQYLQADGGNGFHISNPLFSPDNDGYNDVLNINYELNESGKVANMFVYDSKGSLIKHLVRNQQMTQTGVVSWNGTTQENDKAPIGIYIIYIEVFDLAGKLNTYKLVCTLASKL